MPALDALFKVIEEYQNMTIGYLIFSKIGKVMRHIQLLDEKKVPRDDEFDFRLRAKVLLDQWHQLLTARREGDAVTERIGHMNLNGAA
ncbi:hypothetical protein DFH09DRAFT_1145909 [Mycena vulgaris]|nr:hypothetical protein DFH09DRAFT_1145909 [Mycena vulgaris]